MALLGGGGYAEQVAVPQETVMAVPPSLDLISAAAVPEAWLTAYSSVIEHGQLVDKERVLVHAGASGVGSAAIELAEWRGATVYATAIHSKVARVAELGADEVIDYEATNFADNILELTDGGGVDLIVDFIGAPYWLDNLRALALWGRLILVGLLGGSQTSVDLRLLLSKKLTIRGATLRDRTRVQKARLVAAFTREILPLFGNGTFQPILDLCQFPLSDIAVAHRYMEANRNSGKIVITID
jgi:NADPH:quinone reductase-like Zn-dependent oxidoreductase